MRRDPRRGLVVHGDNHPVHRRGTSSSFNTVEAAGMEAELEDAEDEIRGARSSSLVSGSGGSPTPGRSPESITTGSPWWRRSEKARSWPWPSTPPPLPFPLPSPLLFPPPAPPLPLPPPPLTSRRRSEWRGREGRASCRLPACQQPGGVGYGVIGPAKRNGIKMGRRLRLLGCATTGRVR